MCVVVLRHQRGRVGDTRAVGMREAVVGVVCRRCGQRAKAGQHRMKPEDQKNKETH